MTVLRTRKRPGEPRVSPFVRAAVIIAGVPVLATCASSSTDDATASPSASAASSSAPSTLPALRNGPVTHRATIAGRVPAGTIILRSGVRWLATADAIEEETSPQPLEHAIVVPAASATGDTGGSSPRPVVIGADGWTVYRFDDPLGPGTVLYRSKRGRIGDLGSVPGAVHVTPEDVYVDVVTGEVRSTTNAAPVLPRAIAFLDGERGAATFLGLRGGFVTRDGGKTWSELEADSSKRERPDDLEISMELLHDVFESGAEVPIDVRWVLDTKIDPLAAAVGGVPLASGGASVAVVAHAQRMARIDLNSGAVLEMIETPEHCSVAHTVDGPIAICSGTGKEVPAKQVTAHAVREDPLALGPPTPAGYGTMITSPSGGVATQGYCEEKRAFGAICVRQPDGTWATVEADRPRRDGTGLAWSIKGDTWRIASVDREGRGTLLAQAPPGRLIYAASEDEAGRIWVVAGQDGLGTSQDPIVGRDNWFVGELTGNEIAWQRIVGGSGCALRGRTTVCAVDGGVEVRDGLGPPRRVEARAGGLLEVLPLGFRSLGPTHLGFEQGELPREVDDDSGPHFDGTLVCEGLGPTTKLPPLFRDDEPLGRPDAPQPFGRQSLRAPVDVTGALRAWWIRKEGTMLVRFVDAFAPGTGVQELRFPLHGDVKNGTARIAAVARNGEESVALVLAGSSTFLTPASGAAPKELPVILRPAHAWLGADGLIVTRRSSTMFEHWSPRSESPTSIVLSEVEVVEVDARGFSFVAAGNGAATKGRIAAGRPAGPVHVTDLERADRLGVRSLLLGERCADGEAATRPGKRIKLGGAYLRAILEGEVDGVVAAQLEVVDRGKSACLAGISVAAGFSLAIRMDRVSGKSDLVRVDAGSERREVRCDLTP